jgi:hypothetical protein
MRGRIATSDPPATSPSIHRDASIANYRNTNRPDTESLDNAWSTLTAELRGVYEREESVARRA